MKSFKQFREGGFDNADEIDVKVKKKKKAGSKTPKNKKSGNVEVMPNIPDGKRGMTTNVTNEDAEIYWSSKALDQLEEIQQRESFEKGVNKARRDYRSGTLLTFKQFMAKITDILDEWEK